MTILWSSISSHPRTQFTAHVGRSTTSRGKKTVHVRVLSLKLAKTVIMCRLRVRSRDMHASEGPPPHQCWTQMFFWNVWAMNWRLSEDESNQKFLWTWKESDWCGKKLRGSIRNQEERHLDFSGKKKAWVILRLLQKREFPFWYRPWFCIYLDDTTLYL